MEKKPNVIKKPNLNDELTEDDLKKGFKIKNMKKLGEFDEPDDLLDDESFPDELKDQIRASKTKTELWYDLSLSHLIIVCKIVSLLYSLLLRPIAENKYLKPRF